MQPPGHPAPGWFRVGAYVLAALFAVSAVLQVNDPDPVRWIALYLAAAVAAAALPTRRRAWPFALAVALVALGWGGYLLAQAWGHVELGDLTGKMSERGGYVEVGREAGGLGIVAVGLLLAMGLRRDRADAP